MGLSSKMRVQNTRWNGHNTKNVNDNNDQDKKIIIIIIIQKIMSD